ncbi:hypothetical protein COV18_00830 [Candidatus Woesearchaeota archaeon CG10_big_fil_rev_8_21_14_0_10_37_12]|nr:MAG: hypothetical protein COV18_00830 [Candidatus Woesearchaeota archaeon CG10_big_fil_rev_8_21_14_0_10_37_12]
MALTTFLEKVILKGFFKIELSGNERAIALESIRDKYAKSIRRSIIVSLLILPTIFFLDTELLALVLIPITMVSGTAWFAISLANIKKKFESFGLELTTNMFTSFVSSLSLLAILAIYSLNNDLFSPISNLRTYSPLIPIIAGILGSIAMLKIIYDLFIGALKYDINDSMLSGQHEAAEKFYKRSLSSLHFAAENLRSGKGLQVANYYIGVSFDEVFGFIKRKSGEINGIDNLIKKAHELRDNPNMTQKNADAISIELLENFIKKCKNVQGNAKKNYDAITREIHALKTKINEDQSMIDTRFAMIFEEMADLLENQGESLFRKK